MRPTSFHYFPPAWPFLLALFALFVLVVALIELHVLKYAYERMGIPSRYAFAILLFSLLGSHVNIPVAELPPEEVESDKVIEHWGIRYVVPMVEQWPRTIIAVNVGGALISVLLSGWLLIRNELFVRGPIGVAVVAGVVQRLVFW